MPANIRTSWTTCSRTSPEPTAFICHDSLAGSDEVCSGAAKQHLLHSPDGNTRALCDFPRPGTRLRFQLSGRHNGIDQTQAERRLRVDHVSTVEHFRRFRRSYKLREKKRSAVVRKQSHFRKILSERRRLGSDTKVRRQRDVQRPCSHE